jgi:hypothetical protein
MRYQVNCYGRGGYMVRRGDERSYESSVGMLDCIEQNTKSDPRGTANRVSETILETCVDYDDIGDRTLTWKVEEFFVG